MSPGEIASRGTPRSTASRQLVDRLFVGVCIVTAFFSVTILAILLLAILVQSALHFLSPTIHCEAIAAAPESAAAFSLCAPRCCGRGRALAAFRPV